MIIGIDAREMVGQIAGKGRYVYEIVKTLAAIDQTNQYYLYSKQPIELALPEHFTNVLIGGKPGLRQFWLAQDVAAKNCDLFFAPTGFLPVILARVPTVLTVHDLAVFLCKEARPALKTALAERLLLGLASGKAKKIIAVSDSTKKDLVNYFGLAAQKVEVTALGYDSETYRSQASQKQPTDQSVLDHYKLKPGYSLFIGTLEPRKNIVGIIKAYSQLPEPLQSAHPLVIGGKKGWFYEEIFATVRELNLEKKIQFLGRVPDEHLPALYRQAKVFLFPSYYEGFGLPPLEAIACGTPVISSNISSLPEVVGEAGLLVDPYQPDALVEAWQTLLSDSAIYNQCKAATGPQAQRFSWETTGRQTLAIFEKVARTGKGGDGSRNS